MFTQPEVTSEMRNFVLLDLYTDGSDAASVRNQEIQSTKYGTIAIPFYAIVDPDGNTVTTFPGLTRDATEWLTFLQGGILRASDFAARNPFHLAAITRLAKEVEE
jgi:thiol:disulfide interchange protein DsbD